MFAFFYFSNTKKINIKKFSVGYFARNTKNILISWKIQRIKKIFLNISFFDKLKVNILSG
jgi:hypothetical protein